MKQTPITTRFISAILSFVIFITNAVCAHSLEVNFWKERQAQMTKTTYPKQLPGIGKVFQQTKSNRTNGGFNFLTRYGTVQKIITPCPTTAAASQDVPARQAMTVIHIQDVHRNLEAQKNISGAIESLIATKNARLIALEGAFGPLDVATLRNFPDPAALHIVADGLQKKGKISGAVHAALTFTPNPNLPPRSEPSIVGVDDEAHYNANVGAYRAAAPAAAELKRATALRENTLKAEAAKVFSSPLAEFDREVANYHNGASDLGRYISKLKQTAPATHDARNASLFLQALNLEQELNFHQADRQREELLRHLTSQLNPSQLKELMDTASAFNAGEITQTKLYQSLRALAGNDLKRWPEFDRYTHYVRLSSEIDSEALFEDMRRLEAAGYARLAQTESERGLVKEAKHLRLTMKLLGFELTREEWSEYKTTVHSPWTMAHGLNLQPFEDFYRQAELRDEAMAENLRDVLSSEKLESRSNYSLLNTQNVVVLVTGGFHSAGIDQRLVESGHTVVVFTPRISKIDTLNGSAYLSAFAQEKTPLEKLFDGDKLFLAERQLPSASRGEIVNLIAAVAHRRKVPINSIALWFSTALAGWKLLSVTRADAADILQEVGPHGPVTMMVDTENFAVTIQPVVSFLDLNLNAITEYMNLGAWTGLIALICTYWAHLFFWVLRWTSRLAKVKPSHPNVTLHDPFRTILQALTTGNFEEIKKAVESLGIDIDLPFTVGTALSQQQRFKLWSKIPDGNLLFKIKLQLLKLTPEKPSEFFETCYFAAIYFLGGFIPENNWIVVITLTVGALSYFVLRMHQLIYRGGNFQFPRVPTWRDRLILTVMGFLFAAPFALWIHPMPAIGFEMTFPLAFLISYGIHRAYNAYARTREWLPLANVGASNPNIQTSPFNHDFWLIISDRDGTLIDNQRFYPQTAQLLRRIAEHSPHTLFCFATSSLLIDTERIVLPLLDDFVRMRTYVFGGSTDTGDGPIPEFKNIGYRPGAFTAENEIPLDILPDNQWKEQALMIMVEKIATERGVSTDEVLRHTLAFGNDSSDQSMLNRVAAAKGTGVWVGRTPYENVQFHPGVVQSKVVGPTGTDQALTKVLIATLVRTGKGAAPATLSTPGLDTRLKDAGLLNEPFILHAEAVKKVVNPNNHDPVLVYGGAGADISTYLKSFNTNKGYFVSQYGDLSAADLKEFFSRPTLKEDYRKRVDPAYYVNRKFRLGLGNHIVLPTKWATMAALAFELISAGVDLDTVTIDEDRGFPCINFKWDHGNDGQTRDYGVTLINADITRPDQYPAEFQNILNQGIDAYYQRAGVGIARSYRDKPSFIEHLDKYMKPGGFFVTDDSVVSDDTQPDFNSFEDLSPAFPLPYQQIETPNPETYVPDILAHRQHFFSLTSAESNFALLHYGWNVRIRQKPQTNPALLPPAMMPWLNPFTWAYNFANRRADQSQWWNAAAYFFVALGGLFEETAVRYAVVWLLSFLPFTLSPTLQVVLYALIFAGPLHWKILFGRSNQAENVKWFSWPRLILFTLALFLGLNGNYMEMGLLHAAYNLFARLDGRLPLGLVERPNLWLQNLSPHLKEEFLSELKAGIRIGNRLLDYYEDSVNFGKIPGNVFLRFGDGANHFLDQLLQLGSSKDRAPWAEPFTSRIRTIWSQHWDTYKALHNLLRYLIQLENTLYALDHGLKIEGANKKEQSTQLHQDLFSDTKLGGLITVKVTKNTKDALEGTFYTSAGDMEFYVGIENGAVTAIRNVCLSRNLQTAISLELFRLWIIWLRNRGFQEYSTQILRPGPERFFRYALLKFLKDPAAVDTIVTPKAIHFTFDQLQEDKLQVAYFSELPPTDENALDLDVSEFAGDFSPQTFIPLRAKHWINKMQIPIDQDSINENTVASWLKLSRSVPLFAIAKQAYRELGRVQAHRRSQKLPPAMMPLNPLTPLYQVANERADQSQFWNAAAYVFLALGGLFEETAIRYGVMWLLSFLPFTLSPTLLVILYALIFAGPLHWKILFGRNNQAENVKWFSWPRLILFTLALLLGFNGNYMEMGLLHAAYNLFARLDGRLPLGMITEANPFTIDVHDIEVDIDAVNSIMESAEPKLTTAEEKQIFAALHAKNISEFERELIRTFLIKKYLPFVKHLARKSGAADPDNSAGEGTFGLSFAMNRFDYAGNVPFTFYASLWIKSKMRKSKRTSGAINIPTDQRTQPASVLSIDAKNSNSERTLNDKLGQDSIEPSENIRPYLSLLNSHARLTVKLFHGIGTINNRPYSRPEIAKMFGVTGEAVRQTLNRAHARMENGQPFFNSQDDDADVFLVEVMKMRPTDLRFKDFSRKGRAELERMHRETQGLSRLAVEAGIPMYRITSSLINTLRQRHWDVLRHAFGIQTDPAFGNDEVASRLQPDLGYGKPKESVSARTVEAIISYAKKQLQNTESGLDKLSRLSGVPKNRILTLEFIQAVGAEDWLLLKHSYGIGVQRANSDRQLLERLADMGIKIPTVNALRSRRTRLVHSLKKIKTAPEITAEKLAAETAKKEARKETRKYVTNEQWTERWDELKTATGLTKQMINEDRLRILEPRQRVVFELHYGINSRPLRRLEDIAAFVAASDRKHIWNILNQAKEMLVKYANGFEWLADDTGITAEEAYKRFTNLSVLQAEVLRLDYGIGGQKTADMESISEVLRAQNVRGRFGFIAAKNLPQIKKDAKKLLVSGGEAKHPIYKHFGTLSQPLRELVKQHHSPLPISDQPDQEVLASALMPFNPITPLYKFAALRAEKSKLWNAAAYALAALGGFFEDTFVRYVVVGWLLPLLPFTMSPTLQIIAYGAIFTWGFHWKNLLMGKEGEFIPVRWYQWQRWVLFAISIGIGAGGDWINGFGFQFSILSYHIPINYLFMGGLHAGYNLIARRSNRLPLGLGGILTFHDSQLTTLVSEPYASRKWRYRTLSDLNLKERNPERDRALIYALSDPWGNMRQLVADNLVKANCPNLYELLIENIRQPSIPEGSDPRLDPAETYKPETARKFSRIATLWTLWMAISRNDELRKRVAHDLREQSRNWIEPENGSKSSLEDADPDMNLLQALLLANELQTPPWVRRNLIPGLAGHTFISEPLGDDPWSLKVLFPDLAQKRERDLLFDQLLTHVAAKSAQSFDLAHAFDGSSVKLAIVHVEDKEDLEILQEVASRMNPSENQALIIVSNAYSQELNMKQFLSSKYPELQTALVQQPKLKRTDNIYSYDEVLDNVDVRRLPAVRLLKAGATDERRIYAFSRNPVLFEASDAFNSILERIVGFGTSIRRIDYGDFFKGAREAGEST